MSLVLKAFSQSFLHNYHKSGKRSLCLSLPVFKVIFESVFKGTSVDYRSLSTPQSINVFIYLNRHSLSKKGVDFLIRTEYDLEPLALPISTSLILGLQARITTLSLYRAKDGTQGFIDARQALLLLSIAFWFMMLRMEPKALCKLSITFTTG